MFCRLIKLFTDFRPKKIDGTCVVETQHKIIYVCPKYVTNQTPTPYQEWLRAINDSLDKQVEESDYQNEIIQEIFSLIEKDKISPTEYARMKDEYSEEEYMQEQTLKARKEGVLTMARNLKVTGVTMCEGKWFVYGADRELVECWHLYTIFCATMRVQRLEKANNMSFLVSMCYNLI